MPVEGASIRSTARWVLPVLVGPRTAVTLRRGGMGRFKRRSVPSWRNLARFDTVSQELESLPNEGRPNRYPQGDSGFVRMGSSTRIGQLLRPDSREGQRIVGRWPGVWLTG